MNTSPSEDAAMQAAQHQDQLILRRELTEIVQRMRSGLTTDRDADVVARELRLDAPMKQPKDY